MSFARRVALPAILVAGLAGVQAAQDVIGNFPVVQVPAGNPLTEDKVRLGQALFFEEQLSSDDTMACATCHLPEAGGGDPRAGARGPGADGALFTADDEFGSPGLRAQDSRQDFARHAVFGFRPQATARNSPSVIGAAFFNTQFWDARALPVFRALDGTVILQEFGSLENQALEPILSSVEMGHPGRTWDDVTRKLARVRPLALAVDVPPTLAAFIDGSDDYRGLFRQAFGSTQITRERIALAIASYERTLVADHTPFDLGTMTLLQRRGLRVFRNTQCETCHPSSAKLFTDGARRTISLPDHDRVVKTPSLRNVALRPRFMSSGQFTTLHEVLRHYEEIGFVAFPEPLDRLAVLDFLRNALTDPRVAARQPPFERPLLCSEVQRPSARLFGTATAGSAGRVPEMIADTPSNLGSESFRLGLARGLPGARAALVLGPQRAPAGASINGAPLYVAGSAVRSFVLSNDGAATYHACLPGEPALIGLGFCAQWFVLDPAAAHGIAVTQGAEFELFSRSFRPHVRR